MNGSDKMLFEMYLRDIGCHRLLSNEEEIDLFKKYRDTRSAEIFNAIFYANLKLVIRPATRFSRMQKSGSIMDYIQEGNLGLMTAIEKYDCDRGVKFFIYAGIWIQQKMLIYARKSQHICLPKTFLARLSKYKKICKAFEETEGRSAFIEELAEIMGISRAKVADCVFSCAIECYGIEDVFAMAGQHGNTNGNQGFDISMFCDPDYVAERDCNPETMMIEAEKQKKLQKGISSLSGKEKDVLNKIFFLGTTYTNVGIEYKVSRQWVTKITKKACEKLAKKVA